MWEEQPFGGCRNCRNVSLNAFGVGNKVRSSLELLKLSLMKILSLFQLQCSLPNDLHKLCCLGMVLTHWIDRITAVQWAPMELRVQPLGGCEEIRNMLLSMSSVGKQVGNRPVLLRVVPGAPFVIY